MLGRGTLVAALPVLPLFAVYGQATRFRVSFGGPFSNGLPVITGAPYSAQQVSEGTEPSGRPAAGWREWVYRDSEGRTRTERPMFNPPTANLEWRLIQIVDPVSGYQYVVDSVNRIAHRIKTVLVAENNATAQELNRVIPSIFNLSKRTLHHGTLLMIRPEYPAPVASATDLGERMIDGVSTTGVQVTLDYPGGIRGFPTYAATMEAWVSDERKLVVLSSRNDPLNGSRVTKLCDYRAGEPDPTLFRIPDGFTVVDETGPFRLDIEMPSKPR